MAKKAAAKVKKAKVIVADTSKLFLRARAFGNGVSVMKGSPLPVQRKEMQRVDATGEWKEVKGTLTSRVEGNELLDLCSSFVTQCGLKLKKNTSYYFKLTLEEVPAAPKGTKFDDD